LLPEHDRFWKPVPTLHHVRSRHFRDQFRAAIRADDIAMADDAFALSPISARAAQPSEADYDAIQEAFMETSRGRWFLGEYAKRNRNADTRMVLDAVARIEDTMAASKKPVRDPLLDQALATLRSALTQAREAAQTAVTDLAIEQNLAPVRKGARVIREIAWRLREIGADGRICDLIDSQVGAIETAAARMTPADLAGALSGAFDGIEEKIAALDASEAATSPPAPQVMQAAEAEVPPASAAQEAVAVADDAPAADAEGEPHDAFDDTDEAMLELIAMEMAAPDTDAAYEPKLEDAQIYEDQIHDDKVFATAAAPEPDQPTTDEPHIPIASYEIDVTFPELSAADEAPAVASPSSAVTRLQSAPEPEPKREPIAAAPMSLPTSLPASSQVSLQTSSPEAEPSLGSSLIANGIVPRPRALKPDPLAPIRRMSQTEKIAFFS
jgi:hypothetical protein